jgi:acyl dehydratase
MQIERGFYYEDFKGDSVITTQGRTVTQADIVNFAGLTGDWAELHVNEEYAKTTPFKKPIAHGMLTMSIATGLAILTGILDGTIIAFEGIKSWEFKRPVFAGDTVYAELKVMSREERKLRGGIEAGYVSVEALVKKANGKICQKGIWSFLVKRK